MKKKNIAIVLAAGQGKRMNSTVKKQYLLIQDKPVLYYSLKVFEESFMDDIILVTSEEEVEYCQSEIVDKYGFKKVSKIVVGGKERYHSVANALKEVNATSYIYIHDGARPFVSHEILERAQSAVEQFGACVVGVPVKDTIRIVDENTFSKETPERSTVWAMQTPQVFEGELICNSYAKLIDQEEKLLEEGIKITDDAMVVEYFTKEKVKMVEGAYTNIKITTPEDIFVAEAFCKA